MHRGWRNDHWRTWRRARQASVHGPALHRGHACRDVRVALGVRSAPSREPGQDRAGPQLPRMARRTISATALLVISATQLSGTEEVAARIREARDLGASLRIVGRGHWLDAGRECRASETLDLSALDGVTEYEPGDLTLTARAGTALSE